MSGRGKSKKRLILGEAEWEKHQKKRQSEKAKEYYRKREKEANSGLDNFLVFRNRKIKNIKGLRSGLLIAIQPIFKESKRQCVFWECECDCGDKTIVSASKIIRGETKSCGCKGGGWNSKAFTSKSIPINNIKDYGEIPASYYTRIIKGANKRNIEIKIDIKFLNDLFISQNKKCALSGIDIRFYDKFNKFRTTASLDRIDSNKGYVEGNVQWVHKDINKIKFDLEQKYFIDLCAKVTLCSQNRSEFCLYKQNSDLTYQI